MHGMYCRDVNERLCKLLLPVREGARDSCSRAPPTPRCICALYCHASHPSTAFALYPLKTEMPAFEPSRRLLNPRFDGYKFQPLDLDAVASRHALAHRLSQTNVSGRAALSFQEVRSRVRHNHLAVCGGRATRAAYVDAELRVVVIDIEEVSLTSFVWRDTLEMRRSGVVSVAL